ncbi:MAG: hypothetical protein ACREIF_13265 [Chthoniobacterales bacterium]
MKRWQSTLLLVVGIVCLCLSLVTIVFARQNRILQEAVQAQQATINKGALSQQIGANLLREMATVARTDEKMRKLLQDSGYKLTSPVSASPSP